MRLVGACDCERVKILPQDTRRWRSLFHLRDDAQARAFFQSRTEVANGRRAEHASFQRGRRDLRTSGLNLLPLDGHDAFENVAHELAKGQVLVGVQLSMIL